MIIQVNLYCYRFHQLYYPGIGPRYYEQYEVDGRTEKMTDWGLALATWTTRKNSQWQAVRLLSKKLENGCAFGVPEFCGPLETSDRF